MYNDSNIVKEGNPLLRQISTEVKLPLSDEDLSVLKNLYDYVIASAIPQLVSQYNIRPGVGIAAPQVGINKRMFAINFEDFLDNNKKYTMAIINPKILSVSEQLVYLPGGEGCLSVTRETSDITPRHYAIKFSAKVYDFINNKIKTVTQTLIGYPAIVFQHEYDHLDGKLFVDTMANELPLEVLPLYTLDEAEDIEEK